MCERGKFRRKTQVGPDSDEVNGYLNGGACDGTAVSEVGNVAWYIV